MFEFSMKIPSMKTKKKTMENEAEHVLCKTVFGQCNNRTSYLGASISSPRYLLKTNYRQAVYATLLLCNNVS